MIYIQNNVFYTLSATETLGEGYNLSETNSLDDFKAGKIILLSADQESFKKGNPDATTLEVYNMALTPAPVLSLAVVKIQKIAEIEAYDTSIMVNSFLINGIAMWLDRNTRTSLLATISAYKANGIISITLWTTGSNPVPVTLLVTQLEELLIGLEMYAKACYDVTAQHKANVQALTTAEIVINYDYKVGYPGKLTITV